MSARVTSVVTLGAADWARLVALAIMWGGSFLFIKIAVTELPPFLVVFARVSLAAMALHLASPWTAARVPWDRWLVQRLLILGLANNVIPFSLIFFGQREIPAGLGAILNSTMPIFSVVMAHYLTHDEPMTGRRIAGVLIGVAGVAVLMGVGAITGSVSELLGMGAIILACVSYAAGAIYARRFTGLSSASLAEGQLICASLILLPVVLVVDRPWTLGSPSTAAILAILSLAIMCTAIAYLLYFDLIKTSGASNASLVTLLVPISGVILGALVLHEPIHLEQIGGMALIISGLVVIDGRLLNKKQSRIP
jgi:drug/metabolite transporter (DMT)-like permease